MTDMTRDVLSVLQRTKSQEPRETWISGETAVQRRVSFAGLCRVLS